MNRALYWTLTSSAVSLAACAMASCLGSESSTSNGAGPDGAVPADASRTDASTPTPDASTVDAGAPDSALDAMADARLDATSDAAVSWPDAGIVGCLLPSGPSGLSAAAEGLPAAGIALWLRGDRGVYTLAEDAGVDAGAPPPRVRVGRSKRPWVAPHRRHDERAPVVQHRRGW